MQEINRIQNQQDQLLKKILNQSQKMKQFKYCSLNQCPKSQNFNQSFNNHHQLRNNKRQHKEQPTSQKSFWQKFKDKFSHCLGTSTPNSLEKESVVHQKQKYEEQQQYFQQKQFQQMLKKDKEQDELLNKIETNLQEVKTQWKQINRQINQEFKNNKYIDQIPLNQDCRNDKDRTQS